MKTRTPPPASRESRRAPDWYRCNYLLAVGYSVLARELEANPNVELPTDLSNPAQSAKSYAGEVATVLEETLLTTLTRKPNRLQDAPALEEFLIALEPTVLLLLAGFTRRWGPPPLRETTLKTEHVRGRNGRRAQLLERLGKGLLTDREIVDYVTTLHLDYRARYNLACYYAGRGDDAPGKREESEDYRLALSELSAALRTAPADVADWATGDPSLAGLRINNVYGARFTRLISDVKEERRLGRARPSPSGVETAEESESTTRSQSS